MNAHFGFRFLTSGSSSVPRWCCLLLTLALGAGVVRAQTGVLAAGAVEPYLQRVTTDGATVLWRTAEPAYGWVEYGDTPALGRRQDLVVDGLRAANITAHRVRLEGLKPGAECFYRVVFKPITNFGAYKVGFREPVVTETRSFRTFPSGGTAVSAVVFNDLHDNLDTFRALCGAARPDRADLVFFNGDCLADPGKPDRVAASIRAYQAGVDAGRRPAVFVRGNHETRGAYARELPAWFDWPEGRPYFALTAGPVRFVVLDCGEDKDDANPAYSGLNDFAGYRREQAEWLKKETASPEFRNAAWRVLLHHIPLYAEPPGNTSAFARELWAPALAGVPVDLSIHGHTHRRAFHPAGAVGNPYPVFIGGGPDVRVAVAMVLEADARQLRVRALDASGADALPPFTAAK